MQFQFLETYMVDIAMDRKKIVAFFSTFMPVSGLESIGSISYPILVNRFPECFIISFIYERGSSFSQCHVSCVMCHVSCVMLVL